MPPNISGALPGGGKPAVMGQISEQLPLDHPGLQLVMAVHGFQAPEAWPGLEQQLLTEADLVLAALGVPRQETWIGRLPEPEAVDGRWRQL